MIEHGDDCIDKQTKRKDGSWWYSLTGKEKGRFVDYLRASVNEDDCSRWMDLIAKVRSGLGLPLDPASTESDTPEPSNIDARIFGLWPVPGGYAKFKSTLLSMLGFLGGETRSTDDCANWLMSNFDIASPKTATNYWLVPQGIGLTVRQGTNGDSPTGVLGISPMRIRRSCSRSSNAMFGASSRRSMRLP